MPTTLSQIAPSDPEDATRPTVQGLVEVLLDDHSLVRGVLLPFRESDSLVEVAMDTDDRTLPPMRLRRDSLRALKLAGWPNASILESAPRPFRFEFNDGEVLAGECVSATPSPRGAWLRVVLSGGLKEHWFVDWRNCVSAIMDDQPLSAPRPHVGRVAPARPESLESLWALLSTSRSTMEGAKELPEALLRAGWIDRDALQQASDVQGRAGAHPPLEGWRTSCCVC